MSFRKEKKFRVTIPDLHAFKNELLNSGMSELHETRKINSIYFDTENLNMFFDSEEGILPRKKIRVRWYNNERNFTFEKKISSIEGRYKTTNTMENIIEDGEILHEQFFDPQYGIVKPTLMVSYYRSYFSFRSMRITFDDKITYKTKKTDFTRVYHDPERVIEIKIPANCSDDYIENQIPFATSRFSKFSRGLLLCSGGLNEL